MRSRLFFIILAVLYALPLSAVVGDWVSHGSRLDLTDLFLNGKTLSAASYGGLVQFDIENKKFSAITNTDFLEHIDLLTYYVNSDSSQWFSYGSGVEGISVMHAGGAAAYFNYGFKNVIAFSGNSEHVLAIYKNDFTPEIAHFVKRNNRYIFQDTYNLFPGNPADLYDIAVIGDSIYIASDKGLLTAYLNNPNLKPMNAWTMVFPENTSAIMLLTTYGDSLYAVNEEKELYLYYRGQTESILQDEEEPLAFYRDGSSLYYASRHAVYNVFTSEEIYRTEETMKGFCIRNDTLWIAPENKGLLRVDLLSGNTDSFIPNSMLYTRSTALAITSDRKVAVCGLEGISILDGSTWHNLIFSHQKEAILNEQLPDRFSADTLNIAYRIGGATAVYDAHVSSSGELFCTITDITIGPVGGQIPGTRNPGAIQRIDLNDLYNYSTYDTTNGIIVGTQGLGGSDRYIKMSGVQEDRYGNIWILNIHTLDARPLICIRPDGTIRKYSVEESNNTLQILAREMVFDRYGKLWIANQARQSDIPRTDGGITVFDPNTGNWALISTLDGLINNDINSIDVDPLTGNIWVATPSGVQMIRTPASLGPGTDFSLNPPIDGLSGMIPKKIRIDPKGNKWILTQSQGVHIYLANNRWFNEGSGLTRENSDLLDNVVYDLAFDTGQGYAYLLTPSGLNRYEIAWTETRNTLDEVTVFPQPYRPGVDPYIAIDGLADQSQVKISTLDGRVIKQFSANAPENKGKQIVWDGRLNSGQHISRGVYLLFISNVGGLKTTIKMAVE